jgi:hypothetical protein
LLELVQVLFGEIRGDVLGRRADQNCALDWRRNFDEGWNAEYSSLDDSRKLTEMADGCEKRYELELRMHPGPSPQS